MTGIDDDNGKESVPKLYQPVLVQAGHIYNMYMTVIVRWGAT